MSNEEIKLNKIETADSGMEKIERKDNAIERQAEEREKNAEKEKTSEELEEVRDELLEIVDSRDGETGTESLALEYLEKIQGNEEKKKSIFEKIKPSVLTDKIYKYIYSRFPEVEEGNDPESDEYYLKKVDKYNEVKANESKELGFDKKIAFLGHIHSMGEDDIKNGSDGSLTPAEILEEYKIAVNQLKEKGYDDVYAVITDHNSVNNSVELAELMKKEGVAKPIVGVEATTKEGFEILSYTTDIDKLKSYGEMLESKLGKVMRNAKSGHSGRELVDRLSKDDFVMGVPHPSARKSITLGGTLGENMDKDKDLEKMISENMTFYEGMNWFQDVKGSNCIAFNMRERMDEMNVAPFANEDFHSKTKGSEDTFFNGMFTEIRTDQDIESGEDLLELFRKQKDDSKSKQFIPILKGAPASDEQYKEHLKRASKINILNVLKSFLPKMKK